MTSNHHNQQKPEPGKTFKDHFSVASDHYQTYRPTYPVALFDYLASIAVSHQRAWDCATGTGQTAKGLAPYFKQVLASDPSAAQIKNAQPLPGVQYFVAAAEQSTLEDNSIDIITVSQALHWFDIPAFFHEAERVLKDNGILAIWSYNLITVNDDIDHIISDFYFNVLGEYWPVERQLVENNYQDISFPLQAVAAPAFAMSADWDLPALLGYLSTWSAVKKFQQENKISPMAALETQLLPLWGTADKVRPVSWPLTLIVRKK